MSKIITLVKSSGMTRDEFREYWRDVWLPSLLAVPETGDNLVRIVFNHVLPSNIRPDEEVPSDQWAGFAEMWYYDRPSAERFLASPGVQSAIAAHAEAIPEVVHLHVFEIAGWDRGTGKVALKALNLFIPRDGMSRTEAQRYWSDEHLRETTRLGMSQKLSKYVQNHSFPDHRTADPRYDFAGGPEMWFESMEEAESIFADEALLAELKEDEVKFVDHSLTLVVEEEDVYPAR